MCFAMMVTLYLGSFDKSRAVVRPETPALESDQPVYWTMRRLTNPTTTMFGIVLVLPSEISLIGKVEAGRGRLAVNEDLTGSSEMKREGVG